jgi:hypothetical protein
MNGSHLVLGHHLLPSKGRLRVLETQREGRDGVLCGSEPALLSLLGGQYVDTVRCKGIIRGNDAQIFLHCLGAKQAVKRIGVVKW